jgi:hypothetical protein
MKVLLSQNMNTMFPSGNVEIHLTQLSGPSSLHLLVEPALSSVPQTAHEARPEEIKADVQSPLHPLYTIAEYSVQMERTRRLYGLQIGIEGPEPIDTIETLAQIISEYIP